MTTPSLDQRSIVQALLTHNVVVTASPGSGKTTLALQIVQKYTTFPSLVLSYNTALNQDTSKRIEALNLQKRVHCFTYHGLLSKLTGDVVNDDMTLHEAMQRSDDIPSTAVDEEGSETFCLQDLGTLIIDEAQDLRPMYWSIIQLILSRVKRRHALRIVIVGDPLQMLYGFYKQAPADPRFLTMANTLLKTHNPSPNPDERRWVILPLKETFRLTPPMTDFVNAIFGTTMKSPFRYGEHEDPTVHICGVRSHSAWIVTNEVKEYLRASSHHKPEDIMVLFTSTNNKSAAVQVVRSLVNAHVPVCVFRSGGSHPSPDPESAHGKVRISTFHSTKGLEKDFVIVVNNKPLVPPPGTPCEVSAPLFVALTRARKKLVLVQDASMVTAHDIRKIQTSGVKIKKMEGVALASNPQKIMKHWTKDDTERKYFHVSSMFTYIEPLLVKDWVTNLLETTILAKPSLTPEQTSIDMQVSATGSKTSITDVVHETVMLLLFSRLHSPIITKQSLEVAQCQEHTQLEDRLDALDRAIRDENFLEVAGNIAIMQDRSVFSDRAINDTSFVHSPALAAMYNAGVRVLCEVFQNPMSVQWKPQISNRFLFDGVKMTLKAEAQMLLDGHVLLMAPNERGEHLLQAASLAYMAKMNAAYVYTITTGKLVRVLPTEKVLSAAIAYHRSATTRMTDDDFLRQFGLGATAKNEASSSPSKRRKLL